MDAFKAEDLNSVEVDLSSLGVVNTAMAAMFSKLGVQIKTAVAPSVLEAAYEGRFAAAALRFGQRLAGRVDKQAAVFYEVELTQASGRGAGGGVVLQPGWLGCSAEPAVSLIGLQSAFSPLGRRRTLTRGL